MAVGLVLSVIIVPLPALRSPADPELQHDDPFDGRQFRSRNARHEVAKAQLANGIELISHRLPLSTLNINVGFRAEKAPGIACERNDLNPIKRQVRRVVADDHCRSRFLDFAAYGRVECDPPDVSTLGRLTWGHRQCQQS